MFLMFITIHYNIIQTYIVDPADVGADLGEDCWLLGIIAAQARAKAYNTINCPDTISILAVQGATRITLNHTTQG